MKLNVELIEEMAALYLAEGTPPAVVRAAIIRIADGLLVFPDTEGGRVAEVATDMVLAFIVPAIVDRLDSKEKRGKVLRRLKERGGKLAQRVAKLREQ